MKIKVTLKDPDTMQDAVEDAVRAYYKSDAVIGINHEQRDMIAEAETNTVKADITSRWMPYGEYLTVEFDTDAGTATVVSAKEFK